MLLTFRILVRDLLQKLTTAAEQSESTGETGRLINTFVSQCYIQEETLNQPADYQRATSGVYRRGFGPTPPPQGDVRRGAAGDLPGFSINPAARVNSLLRLGCGSLCHDGEAVSFPQRFGSVLTHQLMSVDVLKGIYLSSLETF